MDLVKALLDPKIYPHKVEEVQLIETHISWVFIAGSYVYKVKKPVNFGFLDYTTLKKRRHLYYKELRLNRRLCQDIYLDVVKITKEDERVAIEGKGRIVEYALKMKRLPEERMMNRLVERLDKTIIEKVAKKLSSFHKEASTGGKIDKFGSVKLIRYNTDENFEQTKPFIGKLLSKEQYDKIVSYTNDFYSDNADLFKKRVKEGRIRDCHGDFHLRNICLEDGVYIYDCIEFNDRFRYSDVASEVAFLAMDLDFHHKFSLSDHFVLSYIESSGDEDLLKLLNFYKCYRAYVRGKVLGFLSMDKEAKRKEREKAEEEARSYFNLALSYTKERPLLVVMCGLIGTGKTEIAERLSKKLFTEVISSDRVRKDLASLPLNERRFDEFKKGIYSPEFTKRTYDALFDMAKERLLRGRGVVVDASFRQRENRLRAKKLAREVGADFLLIECRCRDEEAKRRLLGRKETPSDGRVEIYEAIKREFEEVNELSKEEHILLPTDPPIDEVMRTLMEEIPL